MNIVKADVTHVEDIAVLFNNYRIFYECEPDLKLATRFIQDRISNAESDIFVTYEKDVAIGFVQLYPVVLFC